MAAVPAGMGLGSALKGAMGKAGPALLSAAGSGAGSALQGLGQGAGSALAGGGNQASAALPALPQGAGSSFQIQPIISSGSSAAPLSFSGAGATPANNMDPQILRLIQLMSALKGG